jgi:hypothetical protein
MLRLFSAFAVALLMSGCFAKEEPAASPAHAEKLRLRASTDGCIFGVMTAAADKKAGTLNQDYTAEEDMKIIDFSLWKEVDEKSLATFKSHFRDAMVACYKKYT